MVTWFTGFGKILYRRKMHDFLPHPFKNTLDEKLLQRASQIFRVDFTLGNKFYLNPTNTSIRLCAGSLSYNQMEEGIIRLIKAISWVSEKQQASG